MQRIKEKFQCDMCGKFATDGVTEKDPQDEKRTKVCSGCIAIGAAVLATEAVSSFFGSKGKA